MKQLKQFEKMTPRWCNKHFAKLILSDKLSAKNMRGNVLPCCFWIRLINMNLLIWLACSMSMAHSVSSMFAVNKLNCSAVASLRLFTRDKSTCQATCSDLDSLNQRRLIQSQSFYQGMTQSRMVSEFLNMAILAFPTSVF